jgi:hypothetical protein
LQFRSGGQHEMTDFENHRLEVLRGALLNATETLKACPLINGGAALRYWLLWVN